MSRNVEDILLEIVELCERLRLQYVVMGGLAVRVHGIPRPTFDVDLELTVNQGQLESFFDQASELGYTIAEPFRSGWRDEVGGMPVVKMRTYLQADRGIDVDVFLNETPFQHSVMERREQFEIESKRLNFVTAEDLVPLKLLANRPRDLSDVADILFVQGQLDEAYMRLWADPLGIIDRLETALATTDY